MNTVRRLTAAGTLVLALLVVGPVVGPAVASADTGASTVALASGGLTGRVVSKSHRSGGPSLYVINATEGTEGWVVVSSAQYADATPFTTWWDGGSVVHNY